MLIILIIMIIAVLSFGITVPAVDGGEGTARDPVGNPEWVRIFIFIFLDSTITSTTLKLHCVL